MDTHPDTEHAVSVRQGPPLTPKRWPSYVGQCSCGWEGFPRSTRGDAGTDNRYHLYELERLGALAESEAPKKCRGCSASLRRSDPDLCERCDLHRAEAEAADLATDRAVDWLLNLRELQTRGLNFTEALYAANRDDESWPERNLPTLEGFRVEGDGGWTK